MKRVAVISFDANGDVLQCCSAMAEIEEDQQLDVIASEHELADAVRVVIISTADEMDASGAWIVDCK